MVNSTQGEDKKFASLFPESVKLHAESVGVTDLPDDVAKVFAEDLSYRLRELVSKSCLFMRQGRRKKLKAADVDRACLWSNIPPVLGNPNSLDFFQVEDVIANHDPIINLKSVALQNVFQTQKESLSLSTEWKPGTNLLVTSHDNGASEGNALEHMPTPSISEEYKTYYSTLVQCILTNSQVLFNEIIKDIAVNAKIAPVIPCLVNFLSGITLVSHDLGKLSWMLYTIKALVENKYVSLDVYLTPLLKSVMYCVMEPLAASMNPLNDHWILRDYGARLLSELTYRHPVHTDFLLNHIKEAVTEILADTTRPLCSHYGAMRTIGSLCVSLTKQILLPILQSYVEDFLHPVLADLSLTNVHMKEDAHKVLGAVIDCVGRIFHCEDDCDTMSRGLPISELFGDSLTFRLPRSKPAKGDSHKDETRFSRASVLSHSMPYSLNVGGLMNVLPSRLGITNKRKLNISDVFDSNESNLRSKRKMLINFGQIRPAKRQRVTSGARPAALGSSYPSWCHVAPRKSRHGRSAQTNASLLSWL